MPGALSAIMIVDALISLSLNALVAAQKVQIILAKARSENRDISDAELAQLQADNKTLTDQTLAVLKTAAGK